MTKKMTFHAVTFNDGKYSASLPDFVHNLASDQSAASHPRYRRSGLASQLLHAAAAYRQKIAAVRAFSRSVMPQDVILMIDADVKAFGAQPTLHLLRALSNELLRRAQASIILGAELGRYEVPKTVNYSPAGWAVSACAGKLELIGRLAACRQPQGPCSKPPAYQYPNSGLVLGTAWAINLTTTYIASMTWPTPLTSDQHMWFRALSSGAVVHGPTSAPVPFSLDYCSDLMMNCMTTPPRVLKP